MNLPIKFIFCLVTSSLWFSAWAIGEEISSRQVPVVGSVSMQPSMVPGSISLDSDKGRAHKRQHDEYKLKYRSTRQHAYHRENQPYSKATRCESCHYFGATSTGKNPMQAGRERIEGLFGTEKEGPRKFSTNETQQVNADCLACHNHTARHLHYQK